jgi:prepilin-type N-terminal cleavage/methylation domain-containing protein
MQKRSRLKSADSKAFTLIELLVVIAIIAILAAMFKQVKDQPAAGRPAPEIFDDLYQIITSESAVHYLIDAPSSRRTVVLTIEFWPRRWPHYLRDFLDGNVESAVLNGAAS